MDSLDRITKEITNTVRDVVRGMNEAGYDPNEIGEVIGYAVNTGVSEGVTSTNMRLPEFTNILKGIRREI